MIWNRCREHNPCCQDGTGYECWNSEDGKWFVEGSSLFLRLAKSSPHMGDFLSREEAARSVDPDAEFRDPGYQ